MQFGRDTRRPFPEEARCVCTAAGTAVDPARLAVRSMNFGQHWRTEGIVDVRYSVELPIRYFVAFLEEVYPEQIRDLQTDGEASLPIDVALAAAGYPSLSSAVADRDLAVLLARYWAHDLLLHWLGDGPGEEETEYVLNTVDGVSCGDASVVLTGLGRRAGVPVRYQDV